MKNNDNLFADFIALSLFTGIAKAFSEKDGTDKPKTETKTAEKKCECKCRNQQDLNKELFEAIDEFRIYLMQKNQSLNEVDSFLCNIQERLISAEKK